MIFSTIKATILYFVKVLKEVDKPLVFMRYLRRDGIYTITFKNGAKLDTYSKHDRSSASVVFIRKEYGTVNPGSVVVDIGSNIGSFAIYAASEHESIKVVAVEPFPRSIERLTRNVEINDLQERITIVPAAISSTSGKIKLHVSPRDISHSLYGSRLAGSQTVEVPTLTLKDLFDKESIKLCNLLKMDCEGAEYEILLNSPKSIFKRVEQIRMEYHDINNKNHTFTQLTEHLEKHGFTLIFQEVQGVNEGIAWFSRVE